MQLRNAGQSQRIGVFLKILGYAMLAVGLPGLLLTAVVLLILMPGLWVSGIALSFALVPLLLWLFARSRGKVSLNARDQALEQAYSQAVLAILQASPSELDAAGIAQAVGLSTERAERLLTRLNATERMTSRVTEDGELLFGVTQPERVRIAAEGSASQASSDASAAIVDAELDDANAVERSLRNRT